MQNLYFGLGDNPPSVKTVWYAECGEGHPPVVYVGGLSYADSSMEFNRAEQHVTGGCPACAGAIAARYERQSAVGT